MNSMTEADFAPKKEMYVYRIECAYTTENDESRQFGFTHITSEPIASHHSYILNIVCNNIGMSFQALCSTYFDLQIFKVDTICF